MPLYHSEDKFESGCGWPSFADAVPGAVRRVPDADGQRVEILCAHCGGHLGHVFEGEGFTDKNTRHCVNSLSMSFSARGSDEEKAAFGPRQGRCGLHGHGHCGRGVLLGVEDAFHKLLGVCEAVSGYTGGHVPAPGYEDVSRGDTGHAEAVRVTFDPSKVTYEQVLRRFFEIHDPHPAQPPGSGCGEQYRSAVFYLDEEQKAVAEKLMTRLRELGYTVVTQLRPAGAFYEAEAYHQRFAERTGRGAAIWRYRVSSAVPTAVRRNRLKH